MGKSDIEWTGHLWRLVVGCGPASAGCDNCYAAQLASTRLKHLPMYQGVAIDGVFTGEVRLLRQNLREPLRWRNPRLVFVDGMADLFHPKVPMDFLAEAFAVMIATPMNTYQLLTKRAARMRKMLTSEAFWAAVSVHLGDIWGTTPPAPIREVPEWIWIGVSVEDQHQAGLRLPDLRLVPAAIRWLSVEPLLAEVDLSAWLVPDGPKLIHWVVVGGETGKAARPMQPAWARKVRDQAVAAGASFWFKQWGGWGWIDQLPDQTFMDLDASGEIHPGRRTDVPFKVGKRRAGDRLDERQWREYPRPVPAAKTAEPGG